MNKRIITTLLAATFLAGCTAGQSPFKGNMSETDWDSAAADQVDSRIAEAAKRSSDANETLAQIERARTAPAEPAMTEAEMEALPSELRRPTTVEWTGPGVELVSELARNIGYSFAVVGQEPPVDIMVSVSAVDEPAIKVFEDIGYQVAQFANVFVDPNGKRIEYRFLSNMHGSQSAHPSKGSGMKAPRLAGAGGGKAPSIKKSSLGK